MSIELNPATPLTVFDGQNFLSYTNIIPTPAGSTELISYSITPSVSDVAEYWSSSITVSIENDGSGDVLKIEGRYEGSFNNYTVDLRLDNDTDETTSVTNFSRIPAEYFGVYNYTPDTRTQISAYIHIETNNGSADLIQYVRHDWNADRNALIDTIWGGKIAETWDTAFKQSYLPTPTDIDSSAPQYAVNPNTDSIGEAGTVTFTVDAFNVADGTTLYWTINHGTSSDADFSTSQGTVTIASETASFDVETLADVIGEVDETFTVQVRTDSFAGTVLATSPVVTITQPYAVFNFTISAAYTTSYNVKTQMIAAGWNGSDPALVNLTINTSATVVGGTNTSVAAIYVDRLDPTALSQVTITNYGKILGRGGSGGRGWNLAGDFRDGITGSSGGEPGGAGGTALYVSSTTRINNFGRISGGGGGGGAGQAGFILSYYLNGVVDSGGGGGGAPFGARRNPPSLGGVGGGFFAGTAGVGTVSAGGAGGASQARTGLGYSNLTNIGDGGPGGGYATAGTQGEVMGTFFYLGPLTGLYVRKSGGAAGAVWRGNSFITIIRNGTITGAKL